MWEFGRESQSFAVLLGRHAKERGVNHRALARAANSVGERYPGWRHLEDETVRSWLRNKTGTPRIWQQLAASAQALGLHEDEADELFRSTAAGWTIEQLHDLATESEGSLLRFPKHELVPLQFTIEAVPAADPEDQGAVVPLPSHVVESGKPRFRRLPGRRVIGTAAAAVLGLGVLGTLLWTLGTDAADDTGTADRGTPPPRAAPIGPSCDVDLSLLPFGPQFAVGDPRTGAPTFS